jgi:hypothetical protein
LGSLKGDFEMNHECSERIVRKIKKKFKKKKKPYLNIKHYVTTTIKGHHAME